MTAHSPPLPSRAAACLGVLVLALLAALALAASPAAADADRHPDTQLFPLDEDRGVERLFGADRYATAAAVSERAHPDGADVVVVATGVVFADALAGAGLAAAEDAPVLLVRPGSLPAATATELERLGASEILLLGGTAAVSAEVETALAAHADVTRIGGADRYETAALVAARVADQADVVFVASGANFPDAVAGGAAAAAEGAPILLTRPGSLPARVGSALDDLGSSEIVLLGGTAAVSAEVATALAAHTDTVTRIGGTDRYDTARLVALRFGTGASAFVASGAVFADALTAAPLAAATDAPVVLARPTSAPAASISAVRTRAAELLTVVGGTAAVADVAVADLLGAISDEVTFFGDTHLHGHFGPADGPNLARYSQLVTDRRAAHEHSLFVGSGDEIAPSLFSGVFLGQHMIDALNVSELDVTTMGNHEFDYGPDNAREMIADSDFQWVSANVRDTEDLDSVFAAAQGAELYVTYDLGDVTVGVTGLGPQGMEEVTSMTDDQGVGAERIDTDDALDEVIGLMEADGVDLVVIASHYCGSDARDLADRRADIDLIIGDHCAEVLDEPEFRNGTVLVFVGDEYDHLAEVTFFLMGGEPVALGWHRHDLDETHPEDAAIRAVIDDYEQQLDEAFDEVIGFRTNDWDVRTAQVRSTETGFANYIVDTIRMDADADIGLQNGGGIRSDLVYPGGEDIILRDVVSILPFPNTIVKIEIQGSHILAALENGVSNVEAGDGRFPQVSGMSYVWDPNAAPGQRIVEVQVGDDPLDPNATYTLATNNFLLGGGDGYSMLAEGQVIIGPGEGQLLSEVVADRIRAEETITVATDGRIRRVGQ